MPGILRVVHHHHSTSVGPRSGHPARTLAHNVLVPDEPLAAAVPGRSERRSHAQLQAAVARSPRRPHHQPLPRRRDPCLDRPEVPCPILQRAERVLPLLGGDGRIAAVQPGEVLGDRYTVCDAPLPGEPVMPLHPVAARDVLVLARLRQEPVAAPQIGSAGVDPAEVQPGVPGVIRGPVLGDQDSRAGVDRRETRLG